MNASHGVCLERCVYGFPEITMLEFNLYRTVCFWLSVFAEKFQKICVIDMAQKDILNRQGRINFIQ